MNKSFLLFWGLTWYALTSQTLLNKIATTTSTKGAEISAFDPSSKQLFTVAGNAVEVYSMNPNGKLEYADTLVKTIAKPGYNFVPNSVAVKNNTVAVAWAVVDATSAAQDSGYVSFYNATTKAFISAIKVGFLPDMVTFSPDGSKVLTANEGEPNSYGQANSFDPEGSVSIIDISTGLSNPVLNSATFTSFNTQLVTLKAKGLRVFGPNATVAQDIEPEYITFSADGKTAIVTLQENNALALVDIATAKVTSIVPLGLKNHNGYSTTIENYTFGSMPVLGNTLAGQEVKLGGFSGLHYINTTNGIHHFVTHTDRGPNGEPIGVYRPFMLPNFAPEIIHFDLDAATGKLSITKRMQLKATPTKLLTGLPNLSLGTNGNTKYNDEVPVDVFDENLPLDTMGADLEGITINTKDNSYWMVDEYRPAIYHFDSKGVMMDRFVPEGTAAAANKLSGTYGKETLPSILAQRRQNRGFEAIALNPASGKLYAFVQSPLRNPVTATNNALNNLNNIRIVEFDINTQTTTGEYLYRMDNPNLGGTTNTRADKIGDAAYLGNGEFVVVERDDDALTSGDSLHKIEKKVYKFSITGATNILNNDTLYKSINKTIDQMTPAELKTVGVAPIAKSLFVDLAKAGYGDVEKVEGITVLDSNHIAVINDNDFGVGGAALDTITGIFTPVQGISTDIVLGMITLNSNGLDASDRDGTGGTASINIKRQPVYGMYMPDAIATYTAKGKTYHVTANEGDSRAYTGYSEEVRVGASTYVLDPSVFPNAAALKNNAVLGRLQLSNASGDLDGDGDFDQIHALGARSFSIWDENANLVYDSGDDFEQLTATLAPTRFNSDGLAATFDTRSDNKGPEPEGVAIGEVAGTTYAFIGLERTGDIMVYDINNPHAPKFVEYVDNLDDQAPEGIIFVNETNSPTGKPLVIVSAEVSKTITVYQIGDVVTTIQGEDKVDNQTVLTAYPNPSKGELVNFNKTISASVYSSVGLKVGVIAYENVFQTKGLSKGLYYVKTTTGEVVNFVVE